MAVDSIIHVEYTDEEFTKLEKAAAIMETDVNTFIVTSAVYSADIVLASIEKARKAKDERAEDT